MTSARRTIVASVEFPTYTGGIGTAAYEFARHWSRIGEQVTAVVRLNGEQDREFDAHQPFEVIRVAENGGKIAKFRSRHRALRRVIREQEPAGVYASDWRAGLSALTSGRGKVPYVITVYGTEFTSSGRGGIDGTLQRLVMRRARRVICISRYVREMAVANGAPSNRVTLIPLGADPERFAPGNDAEAAKRAWGWPGRKVMLSVARLVKRKDHETVLRALPAIIDRVPDVLYVLAGDGPVRTELERVTRDLDLGDHVRFLGDVAYDADVPKLYPAADLFVLTSTGDTKHGVEGFGIVFLEAGCCEMPVIGTRAGGVPDAVEENVTGFLTDPGSQQQIADAAIRLLTDPDLASRMGRAGRERVLRDFTWGRVAERTLEQMYG